MGNDGGSIPTRRELVKSAARNPSTSELKATQLEAQTHAWTYCPLSNTPLRAPIVSDHLGTLYNKDAVLEHLLPSADSPQEKSGSALPPHIKGLRDIVEVKFTTAKEGGGAGEEAKKICPITSKELGAHTKAVYLVPCGHAFSETAIRELKGDRACVECGMGYEAESVIAILPLGKEEKGKLEERMRELREKGLTHSGKKAPGEKKKKKEKERGEKRKLDGAEIEESATMDAAAKPDTVPPKPKSQQQETSTNSPAPQSKNGTSIPTPTPSGIKTASTGIKNASTASLTAKVLDEQEERNKRRKLGMNENLKSLFSNTGYNAHQQKGGDFMTRGFSMPRSRGLDRMDGIKSNESLSMRNGKSVAFGAFLYHMAVY
ncbi:Replication termination factor 2 [Clarireedia jacksonii]